MIKLRWLTHVGFYEEDEYDTVTRTLQYCYLIEQEETGHENWSQWFDVEEVEE